MCQLSHISYRSVVLSVYSSRTYDHDSSQGQYGQQHSNSRPSSASRGEHGSSSQPISSQTQRRMSPTPQLRKSSGGGYATYTMDGNTVSNSTASNYARGTSPMRNTNTLYSNNTHSNTQLNNDYSHNSLNGRHPPGSSGDYGGHQSSGSSSRRYGTPTRNPNPVWK